MANLPPELTGGPIAPRRSPRLPKKTAQCDECDAPASECDCAAEAAASQKRLDERVAAAQEGREAEDWSVVRDPGRKAERDFATGGRVDPHDGFFGEIKPERAPAGVLVTKTTCHPDGSMDLSWRCRECHARGTHRFSAGATKQSVNEMLHLASGAQCRQRCARRQKAQGMHPAPPVTYPHPAPHVTYRHSVGPGGRPPPQHFPPAPEHVNCRTVPGSPGPLQSKDQLIGRHNHGPMVFIDEAESFLLLSEEAQESLLKHVDEITITDAADGETKTFHVPGREGYTTARIRGVFPDAQDPNQEQDP